MCPRLIPGHRIQDDLCLTHQWQDLRRQNFSAIMQMRVMAPFTFIPPGSISRHGDSTLHQEFHGLLPKKRGRVRIQKTHLYDPREQILLLKFYPALF